MLSGQWSLRRQERPSQETQQPEHDASISFDNGDGTIFLTQSEILQLDPMMDSVMVEDVALFDDESQNSSQVVEVGDGDTSQNIWRRDEVEEKENGSPVRDDSFGPTLRHTNSKTASWAETRSPTTPSSTVLTPKVENAKASGDARRSTCFSPKQIPSMSFTFDGIENDGVEQSGLTDNHVLSSSVTQNENSFLKGASAASIQQQHDLFERRGMPEDIAEDEDQSGHVDDDSVENEIANTLEPMQKYFLSDSKLSTPGGGDSSGEMSSPFSQDRSLRNENVSLPSFQSGEVYEDCDEDSDDQIPAPKLKIETKKPTTTKDESRPLKEPLKRESAQDPYQWAYDVWRKKGLLGNRKMATPVAPNFEEVAQVKTKEIKLQTPNESCVPFDFRGFEEDSVDQPLNKERLSLPAGSLPAGSAPKADQSRRNSFANILQHWREKSDDKPNSHFLSPEANSPVRQSAKLKDNDSLDVVSMQLKQKLRRESLSDIPDTKEEFHLIQRDRDTRKSWHPSKSSSPSTPWRKPSPRLSPVREASQKSLNSDDDIRTPKPTNPVESRSSSRPSSLVRERSQLSIRIEDDEPPMKNSHQMRQSLGVTGECKSSHEIALPMQTATPASPTLKSPPSQASIMTGGLRKPSTAKIGSIHTDRQNAQHTDFTALDTAYTGSLQKSKNDYKSVVRKVLCVVRERSVSAPRPPREPKYDGRAKSAPRTSRKSLSGRKTERDVRYKPPQQANHIKDDNMPKHRWVDPVRSQQILERSTYDESERHVQLVPRQPNVTSAIRRHLPGSPGLLPSKHLFPSPFSADSTNALGALHFEEAIEDGIDGSDARVEELTQMAADYLTRSTPGSSTEKFFSNSDDRSDPKVSKFAAIHEKSQRTVEQMLASPVRARSRGHARSDSPSTKELVEKVEHKFDLNSVISPPQRTSSRPWNHDNLVQKVGRVPHEASDLTFDVDRPTSRTCQCSKSVFSGNDELIDFFLPLMGMACSCGKRSQGLVNPEEPTGLENILRPWQVEFLAAFGIYRGDQLVKAHHRSANALASALRQYRKKHNMTPFRTKSCGMALQIWSKTSKAFVRSIRNQLIAGKELKVPNTLYIVSSFLEQLPSGSPGGVTPRAQEFESETLEL